MSLSWGSPPPTRGKQSKKGTDCHMLGITPAYAGKTIDSTDLNVIVKDHPRLRGENHSGSPRYERAKGSPPPTRGKPFRAGALLNSIRITPAYAGKTLGLERIEFNLKDHPRLRGENPEYDSYRVGLRGSPPPTRGKHVGFSIKSFDERITPAYAGKTEQNQRRAENQEDHPRLRGENRQLHFKQLLCKGSPPPTRGKPA